MAVRPYVIRSTSRFATSATVVVASMLAAAWALDVQASQVEWSNEPVESVLAESGPFSLDD